MTTVARQTLDILQSPIAHRSSYRFIFGRYEARAYITDGAFLVFMTVEEHENIMLELKLRPRPGTYQSVAWIDEGSPEWIETTPTPEKIRQAIPDLAAPRIRVTATRLSWDVIWGRQARIYQADEGLVLIDSLYVPLLADPVYSHGPWDRLALWTEDQGQIGAMVLRLKEDHDTAQSLWTTLAQLHTLRPVESTPRGHCREERSHD